MRFSMVQCILCLYMKENTKALILYLFPYLSKLTLAKFSVTLILKCCYNNFCAKIVSVTQLRDFDKKCRNLPKGKKTRY